VLMTAGLSGLGLLAWRAAADPADDERAPVHGRPSAERRSAPVVS
jgi:hypothetical protein